MISYDELEKMSLEKLIKLAHYYDLYVPKNPSKRQVVETIKDRLEFLSFFSGGDSEQAPQTCSVRVQRAMESMRKA